MAKIFEVDFRTGSYIDVVTKTSLVTPGASCSMTKGDNGLQLLSSGITGNMQVTKPVNGSYDLSFAIRARKENAALGTYIFEFRGTSGYVYLPSGSLVAASGTAYIDGTVYIPGTNVCDNKWHHFIISGITCINNVGFGINGNPGNSMIGNWLFCRIFDHRLTEIEKAKEYNDFLNSYPIDSVKTPDYTCLKPMDLSVEKNNTLTPISLGVWQVQTGTPVVNGQSIYFPTDAITSSVAITNGWVIGKRYQVTYQISNYNGTGTGVIPPYDGGAFLDVNGVDIRKNSNGVYNYTYIPTAAHPYIATYADVSATITVISIKEITGLVAAYNMIPNGNTLVDISGNGKNATISGGVISTKDGVKTIASRRGQISSNVAFSGSHTISLRFKQSLSNVLSGQMFEGNNSSSPSIEWSAASGGIWTYYIHTAGGFKSINIGSVPTNKFLTISCVYNNTAQTATVYLDGVEIGNTTATLWDQTVTSFYIGYRQFGSLWQNGEYQDFRIYNRAISAQEAKAYHNLFVNTSLKVDFSDEGADGISKVPSGWSKVSGAFKIGEISGLKGGELTDNGGFDTDAVWITGAGWTISNGKAHALSTGTSGLSQSELVFITGHTYRVRCEISNYEYGGLQPQNTSQVIGYKASNGTFDVVFTATITGATLLYCVGASSFSIDNYSITEVVLPTMKNGTKYLECVTAGIIAIPSKQAYGTWEWDWFKGADTNATIASFVSNRRAGYISNNGYELVLWNNEAIYLEKTNIGSSSVIGNTATAYAQNNTWYRIKITRYLSGVFTLFIKGGSFVPTAGYDGWTLVSVIGGAGANPGTDTSYTTSEYFVLDIDAGDRIANIQLTDGIVRNELYGAELIDQNAWYTAAYWTDQFGANWSQAGTTLSSNGSSGNARILTFLTLGKRYKIDIEITRTSGSLYVYDGFTVLSDTILSAAGKYTLYLTATNTRICLDSLSFNGTVTALSIKEVTQE